MHQAGYCVSSLVTIPALVLPSLGSPYKLSLPGDDEERLRHALRSAVDQDCRHSHRDTLPERPLFDWVELGCDGRWAWLHFTDQAERFGLRINERADQLYRKFNPVASVEIRGLAVLFAYPLGRTKNLMDLALTPEIAEAFELGRYFPPISRPLKTAPAD